MARRCPGRRSLARRRRNASPSPWGEGRCEGEQDAQSCTPHHLLNSCAPFPLTLTLSPRRGNSDGPPLPRPALTCKTAPQCSSLSLGERAGLKGKKGSKCIV